jgi:hypothetical protein
LVEMTNDGHRLAIEEWLGFHGRPPQHLLGEARRSFRRIELMPNGRMNSVSAYKNVCLVNVLRSGMAIDEVRPYPTVLLKAGQLQPGTNILASNAVADGAQQEELKFAAMDRLLRPAISSVQSATLGIDELAELVAEIEPARRNAGLRKRLAETKLSQFAYCSRLQIDANAER